MPKAAPSAVPAPIPTLADRAREICGYVVFTAATLLLIASVSYVDKSSPDAGTSLANRCGDTGYLVARTSLFWFGYGVYLGIFTLFLWGVALVSSRAIRVNPFRLLWLGFFIFSASAFVSHLALDATETLPDPGGLVGREIALYVDHGLGFGAWGTKVLLLVAAVIFFQLATDFVLVKLLLAVRDFARRRRTQAGNAMERVGPLFRALLEKKEGSAATGDGRQNVEIAVTDEEVEGFPEPREGAKARRAEKPKADVAPATANARDLAKVDPADVVAAAAVLANEDAAKGSRGETADASKAKKPKGGDPKSKPVPQEDETDDPDDDDLGLPPLDAPPILDEDKEAEVVPPPPDVVPAKKPPAKIHLEPPQPRARAAAFENETLSYSAPAPSQKREYSIPPIGLLEEPRPINPKDFQKMIEGMSETLESSLRSYKVDASVVEIQKGPVITMFEINVAEGTRVDRIRALEDDLAIRLKVPSVRIVAPIPGKSTIGIEVPNRIRETVCLRELLIVSEYNSANFAIPIFLGKDAAGRPLIEDLAKMPHLLVAGATGAGKSVCLNSIIMSILFTRTPDQVKMILIDPKMVELSLFENIPHLACPVVRDMNRAAQILEWACAKMDERYEIMAEVGARNIFAYNKLPDEEKRAKLAIAPEDETFEPKMPFIVIVVDELADLMMVSAKDVENHITRLAQKSRAVGIHIILATQRPSTNVITGLIKANLPTRISFQVASKIDSRVVLDQNGAEKLLGFGDMLYLPPRTSMMVRGQGGFVSDDEIRKTVDCVKIVAPQYQRDLIQKNVKADEDPRLIDDLYDEATRFVCETKRGSASLLQRRFSIGYTRASRLIDLMATDGILGEYKNAQAREVLLTLDEYEERQRQHDAAASRGGNGGDDEQDA